MIEIASTAALRAQIGQEVAVSEWIEVTQQRIDQFAEATEDRQWIHLDRERAARESPYGATIAHGFLTLSLVSAMFRRAATAPHVKMAINYGLNRVRFVSAVPAGSRLRARFTPIAVEDVNPGTQVTWKVVVEREGHEKPSCVAEWLARYYE